MTRKIRSRGRPVTKMRDGVSVFWWREDYVDAAKEKRFERMMKRAVKRGFVYQWDMGRGMSPWYNAYYGPEEEALRKKCAEIFGEPSEVRMSPPSVIYVEKPWNSDLP